MKKCFFMRGKRFCVPLDVFILSLELKNVFFLATAGNPTKNCFNALAEITEEKHGKELGRYICKGYDSFGPFKLVGGIQKGHPTDEEVQAAVDFYKGLQEKVHGNTI